jgi:hypothetical protein
MKQEITSKVQGWVEEHANRLTRAGRYACTDSFLVLLDCAALGFVEPDAYPEFSTTEAVVVLDALAQVLDTLFPASVPPPEFWSTFIGDALLQARCWAMQDELLTLSQAAALSGKSLSHLSNYSTLRLARYPNPGGGFRVLKLDVMRVA